jgi:hypothetical protein
MPNFNDGFQEPFCFLFRTHSICIDPAWYGVGGVEGSGMGWGYWLVVDPVLEDPSRNQAIRFHFLTFPLAKSPGSKTSHVGNV